MIKYNEEKGILEIDGDEIKFTLKEKYIFNLLIMNYPRITTHNEIAIFAYNIKNGKFLKHPIFIQISNIRKKTKGIFDIINYQNTGYSIRFDKEFLNRF